MNTKLLGVLALMGAPCMAIGLLLDAFAATAHSPWMGIWSILYISGWMASIMALRELGVFDAGTLSVRRFGYIVGRILLVTLVMANSLNVWEMVAPTYKPTLFYIVDMGWPLSNLLMLPLGIAVIRAGRLTGWQRWVPLAVGCWLPITLLFKDVTALRYLPLIYSAIAWTLLALVVLLQTTRQQRESIISGIALRDEAVRPMNF